MDALAERYQVTQTYDAIPDFFFERQLGVVTSQTDAFGHTTTFETVDPIIPSLGDKQVVITNPDGTQRQHLHSRANILSAMIDETGVAKVEEMIDTNKDGAIGWSEIDAFLNEKQKSPTRADLGKLIRATHKIEPNQSCSTCHR